MSAENTLLPSYIPNSLFPNDSPAGSVVFDAGQRPIGHVERHEWRPDEAGIGQLFAVLMLPSGAKWQKDWRLEKSGWTIASITLSDKGSRGLRVDESGPLIHEIISPVLKPAFGRSFLIPDDGGQLKSLLCHLALVERYDLIITTGGTGVGTRDITPQITESLLDLPMRGIVTAMLLASIAKTPNAIISRAAAGVLGNALVINLPGSRKAVRENLEAILPGLGHALDKINGDSRDCGAV